MITLEKINLYFEMLHNKALRTPHRLIQHNQYDIKSLYFYKKEYCNWLFQSYQKNEFYFSELNKKLIKVGPKDRWIFQYPLPDLILHYCVADYIKSKTELFYIKNLFSYRKGKNSNQALELVNNYIRQHKSKTSNKKNWGLFVIRKDITQFSDSIKSDEESKLYKMLLPFISELNAKDLETVKSCLNPVCKSNLESDQFNKKLGHLPMGSPLVGYLTNFYLNEMDNYLAQNKSDLYIRFGDDILYITSDIENYTHSDTYINTFCTSLGLNFNIKKTYNTYLTSAGVPIENLNETRRSTYFEYLGMKINFNTGIELTSEKYKNIFKEIRSILKNYKNNIGVKRLDQTDDETHIKSIVSEFNLLLNLKSEKNLLYLDRILKLISDHSVLNKIDYDIAFEILAGKYNKRSKKNFRNNEYQKLRTKYKLRSIEKYKNDYFSKKNQ